jgi:prolyl-tRNA editing enzyme YbaK/EbsC (Cys-tRNA(Pro) deacylase)
VKTRKELRGFLAARGIEHEILELKSQTYTVGQASSLTGASAKEIAKTLVLISEDGVPVAVVVRGDKRVPQRWLAKELGLNRLRLARPHEVLEVTGYAAGGVPPVDLPGNIVVVVDEDLLTKDSIITGGGDESSLLKISPLDIVKLNPGSRVLKVPKEL